MSGYWEAGWSREQQRYYYMDKASGKSQWSRPPGCELDLPTVPPKEGSRAKSPPPPTDLPPGWKAELDITPQVNRYFYYREAKPDMRTWYKPLHPSEDDEQEAHQEEQDEAEKVKALTKRLYMFARPIQQLKAQRDEAKKKKLANELIQDVFRANSDFIAKSDHITVPVSKQVEYNEVLMALQSKSLKAFDRPPKVTFAQTSLASAAVLFRQQDPKRHICIVNCCCGVMPPPLVGFHQETELYCQVPSLLASLCLPKPFVVCPFGPAAKKEDTSPKKQEGKEEWDSRFSTVVYSPDCVVCRNSVSEDFEALPLSSQTVVSVINSALPLKAQHGHLDTRQLEKSILETLTSAFATPVMRSPVCTTLIVGAWGCGEHFATQTETVATKLAELLAGKLVEHVRVGWLFSEVHFCFPHYDVSITGQSTKKTDKDPAIDIFRRIFDQHHINPRLL